MMPVLKILIILLFAAIFLKYNNFINHFDADVLDGKDASGIKGQVFIAPISPVEKAGIPNKAPYEAFLNFVDSHKNQIKKIQTDENGKFGIKLEPGSYTIIPEPISSIVNYPIGESKDVIVSPGKITFVEINFDSGIR